MHEVRELRTALGLFVAESGVCLVSAAVKRLRRENVVCRALNEPDAVSPIIMSTSANDRSPEIALTLSLVKTICDKDGPTSVHRML